MKSAELVSVEQLQQERYAAILCYPSCSANETTQRITELKRLGVKSVEFAGEKRAFNVPVLGKGCVGIVLVAHTETGRIALKIRRVDADRKGMEHEAEMLARANNIGVGPRFIAVGKDFLLMEYVEGDLLPKWIASLKGKGYRNRILSVLRQVIEQCWKLDKAGLDHGELSRAPRHILVDAEDKAHILDFETASIIRRTSNVTSICQYLFLGSQVAITLRRKLGEIDKKSLTTVLRDYKLRHTDQNLARILQVCKLA